MYFLVKKKLDFSKVVYQYYATDDIGSHFPRRLSNGNNFLHSTEGKNRETLDPPVARDFGLRPDTFGLRPRTLR